MRGDKHAKMIIVAFVVAAIARQYEPRSAQEDVNYLQLTTDNGQRQRGSYMRYEFATAQRIIVGPGSSAELADSAAGASVRRALLALGRGTAARGGPAAALAARLAEPA